MSEKSNLIYGCDIGNGFGYISLMEEDSRSEPVTMFPVLPGLNVNEGMPTAAYLTPPDGKNILVFSKQGKSADIEIRKNPSCALRAVKTWLPKIEVSLPGLNCAISPYRVYGTVVHDLVRLANLQRKKDNSSPIYDVVLAYPASFNNFENGIQILNKMQESVESIFLEGHKLKVIGRIPEPAAVAIDYLNYLQHHSDGKKLAKKNEFTALVYDLGHGTFDTAVVTVFNGKKDEPYRVWATDGLPDVGGKDFNARLFDELLLMLKNQYSYEPRNEVEREELMREAISAKHELSDYDETTVRHQNRNDGSYMEMLVTKKRFEEITSDLLMRTFEMTQQMLNFQTEKGRKIDAIVLSGGASQMPMVKSMLEQCFQPTVMVTAPFHPSKAVSYGAALYAASLSETSSESSPVPKPIKIPIKKPIVQLLTRHSYGFLKESPHHLSGEIEIMLPSEEALPANSKPFEIPLDEGRWDLRVYRPKNGEDNEKEFSPENFDNMIWLHFDIPKRGRYTLVLSVDSDYNITAELTGDDFRQQRSTKVITK